MEEVWKTIEGFPRYQVSNLGRVKSLVYKKPVFLKLSINHKNGYYYVTLCNDGYYKRASIHRLVALAFIPNPDNLPQVNHKDENKENNCVSNLEWCTHKYNSNYGTKNQRVSASKTGKMPKYIPSFKGHHHNEEFIKQLSARTKGRIVSQETRQKMSEARKKYYEQKRGI